MPTSLRTVALQILARRDHSSQELKNKLLQRGFLSDEIEALLKQLHQQQLQSDTRFIINYIQMRANRGWGPLKIMLELQQRGIGQKTGQLFLAQIKLNWVEIAARQLHKKFNQQPPESKLALAKQINYLTRKGFTSEQIRACMQYEKNH